MPNDLPEGYEVEPPPKLIDAIIHHESKGNPNAVSSTGATGLMQIEPSVAKDYGVDPKTLTDPKVNRDLGTKYFKKLLNQNGGDTRKALIAYNQGPNREGMAPGVEDYADRVMKTASTPSPTPTATPTPDSGLPEGYKMDLPAGYSLDTHPAPNPMIETGGPGRTPEQEFNAQIDPATAQPSPHEQIGMARHATAQLEREHAKQAAPLVASTAAMMLTDGLINPYTEAIGFEGYPAVSMLVKHLVKSAALTAASEGATTAVTGQAPTVEDSAKNLALFTAFGIIGEAPGMLASSVSKSPAAMAMLDKTRLAAGKFGPKTANVADKVVDFFKSVSPEMTPAQLAAARQSADEGNKIAEKVNSVSTYHGKKLQAGLRDNLGDMLDARVDRNVVEDPIQQALEAKPYLKQGLSPRMQSVISKFTPADAGTAPIENPFAKLVKRYREQGLSDSEISYGLKQAGAKTKEITAALGTGPDSANFYSQPDYSVDELTQVNSRLNAAVHTGSQYEAYDKDLAQYVSRSLKSSMHDTLATNGATTDQLGQFDQFFKDWAAHKQLQDAMEMASTGSMGIEQADRVWKIASDVTDKNGAEKFNSFLKLAQELDSKDPNSQVLPTLREAFNLRLSKAYSLGDTPEASRKAVEDAISAVPMETRMAVFGRGSPLVDARRAADLLGHLDNSAEAEQMKAAGVKAARSGRPISPYIQTMLWYAGLKTATASRSKGSFFANLTHPKPEDIPILAASLALGFRGPQMARAVFSYASVPFQKAYETMINNPGDPAAIERFARGLNVIVGAGQGAVAGSQSGHPYLGAAIGAALNAQGPGAEGTIEGSEAPRKASPPAPPEPQNPNRPGNSNQVLANRVQGFKKVGEPQTQPAPQPAAPAAAVSNPPQLPAKPAEDPMEALRFLKAKTAQIPKTNLNRAAPLRDGTAVPLLPGGQAGPEGAGQFVARGAPVSKPYSAPAGASTAPPAEAAPQPGLFGEDPRPNLNTDFRKMRLEPNPTRFESPASVLGRNPERWQFKESNAEGLTDALSGVKNYDAIQGGDLIAYFDPATEKLEVIDGHQRHFLAKGDNDAKVPYFVLDGGNQFKGALAHGVTPEAARAYAAVRNLRAGTGSSLDIAKFVRDTGLKIDDLKELNVPLSGPQTKDGLALSHLDDNVFREVAQRRFPERMGIVLGTELPDNPVQIDILKQVRESEEKGKPVSPALLQEWIRQAKGSSGDSGQSGWRRLV